MKIHIAGVICIPCFIVFQVIFHVAAAGLQEDSQNPAEGRKLDQSQLYNNLINSASVNFLSVTNERTSSTSNNRSKVKKSRVKRKEKSVQDVLILNETPNKTLVYEIPVSNSKSSGEDVKSGSVSKREIAKHPEQMKNVEVMREDKLISEKNKMGKPNNPSKNYEMKSPMSLSAGSVSDPRTLLLAPLLIAGPMMLAEAMTVGGMGLAVPGIIILPLLLIPLIVISFIIFI